MDILATTRLPRTDTTATLIKQELAPRQGIQDYYNESTLDYEDWSAGFNMHFGYWKWGMNPFKREQMLETMSGRLIAKLRPAPGETYFDLGCGVGAATRHGQKNYPFTTFKGFTLAAEQVKIANDRWPETIIQRADYHRLPEADGAADGAFFLESHCHSDNPDVLFAEVNRVLKPGGTLVISDGFLIRPLNKCSSLFQKAHRTVSDCWAVPNFPELERNLKALKNNGFEIESVEDWSWRVGPSAIHAPCLSLWVALKHLVNNHHLSEWRKKHLVACALSLVLGACMKAFRYKVIVARKVA